MACLCLACLGLVSCVGESDDDLAVPDSNQDRALYGLASVAPGPIDELAFAADSRFTPTTDPGGSPYLSCSIEYGTIDWEADPETIVQAHTAASAVPCAGETWYHNTAFQNGILTFMALVGEQNLAAAAPKSETADAVAISLRSQGFDRLAAMDIASSGRCEQGQVQAALFTLRDADQPVEGLEALLESAEVSGAEIERTEAFTVITGAGAPCATAIVHRDRILGWVTTDSVDRLKQAVGALQLSR